MSPDHMSEEELRNYIGGVKDQVKTIPLAQATPLRVKQGKLAGKPLPTVYRHVLNTEWCRAFSWKERLGVLFGGNLVVAIGVACQHNPGAIQPLIIGRVTTATSATEYMRGIVRGMIEEQVPPSLVEQQPNERPPEVSGK